VLLVGFCYKNILVTGVLCPTYFPMYFVWWWEYFVWC